MHWIVQTNIYSEPAYDSVLQALERLRLPFSVHRCIPFAGTLEPDPNPQTKNVVILGTYTLAKIAQTRGWTPGVFVNDNFTFFAQSARWGERMFNADATVYSFGDVALGARQEPFFIRPVDDSKSFVGTVHDAETFLEWQGRVLALTPEDNPTLNRDTEVIVARKKPIFAEYRTWIVDGRVVAWSQYKTGSRKHYIEHVDERVLRFAEECAAVWSPHRAYVLDVFEGEEGLRIGEVNCLNCAGYYAANVQKIIEAIEISFGDQ